MCGIAGIHVFEMSHFDKERAHRALENAVDSLLFAMDHRGGDATGFVALTDEGNATWQKASCNAIKFYKDRRPIPYYARSILLHTRMATQGEPAFPENNHPIRRGSVYIIHNGHVFNDWEIFRKAKRERYAQVDSEAIAAIIAKYGIMNTHKAMEEVEGAAAIGAIDETRPGIMVLARGSSSPLVYYRNDILLVFASTKDAVKKAWKDLFGTPPSDKKITEVDEGTALYLEKSGHISKKLFVPGNYYHYGNKIYRWNDWEEKKDGSFKKVNVTVHSDKVTCAHNKVKKNCTICNPDDNNGAFLPVKKKNTDWLAAKKCDFCNTFFPADELTEVNDFDDSTWVFCDACFSQMADVIADCDLTKPVKIHGMTDDEIISLD